MVCPVHKYLDWPHRVADAGLVVPRLIEQLLVGQHVQAIQVHVQCVARGQGLEVADHGFLEAGLVHVVELPPLRQLCTVQERNVPLVGPPAQETGAYVLLLRCVLVIGHLSWGRGLHS